MKKKIVTILISGLVAASMLTACGSGGSSSGKTDNSAKTSVSKQENKTSSSSSSSNSSASAESESSNISFVDGYYSNDGKGNDFIIAFYENAPGDVAYVSDGTNEAFAEYKVEKAQTDEGNDYYLITVGKTQLGYIQADDEGNAYIVDTDGNIYAAKSLSEDQADAIYEALQEADANNADVDSDAQNATDVEYVDGYYASNGNGSDFMIAFYSTSAGDLAYVTDGEYETIAAYDVSDDTTDEGVDYKLVTVGNMKMGYYTDDDDNIYIVDEDGNIYAGGQLDEETADQIYNIVTSSAE